MYPFKWHHVYIPVLNITLHEILQAPTPYVIGVTRSEGLTLPKEVLKVTDAIVVDLDVCRITGSAQTCLPEKEVFL